MVWFQINVDHGFDEGSRLAFFKKLLPSNSSTNHVQISLLCVFLALFGGFVPKKGPKWIEALVHDYLALCAHGAS
jgi:hypothetical protein